MKFLIYLISILILSNLFSCNSGKTLTNLLRDEATENLLLNLKVLSTKGKIMYGCANPTTLMYKETHIYTDFNNSDCKEITGQNPAFYESDFMWYEKDSLRIADIEASKEAFKRGAVIGYCWHLIGKESNSFYSKSREGYTKDKELAKKIIAGGDRNENPELNWFLTELDTLVIATIKEFGFPIIFRPWHEMNGFWFWWGSENCNPDEYIKLYRLTVEYMRSQGLKNVLYSWSPDTYFTQEYYPGNEYVDVIGLDMYEMGAVHYKPMDLVITELEKLTDFAAENNKVAGITETGLRKDNDIFRYPEEIPDYWSAYVLDPLLKNPKLNRIVFIESWYSSDWSRKGDSQFYYPYKGIENDFAKGQEAIDDFLKFYNNQATLFEDDLPDMYSKPIK